MKNVDGCDNAAVHLGGLTGGDGRVTRVYHVECVEAASGQVSADWHPAPREWEASLLQPSGLGQISPVRTELNYNFLSDCNILMEPEVIFRHNSPAVKITPALSCPLVTDIISERWEQKNSQLKLMSGLVITVH